MKNDKKIRVMGFGTFDGVHPGHLDFFKQLNKLGDELIIVVARDKNVEKIKGSPARYNEEERLNELLQIKLVDRAVLGNEEDYYQVIRDHKPNAIGLGYDQKADEDKLKELFPEIEIKRLEAHQPEKFKSSIISGPS